MIDKIISLKIIRKNRTLIEVKSGLHKFYFDGFYVNNKINSTRQTLFT